jgi:hypothetical protein
MAPSELKTVITTIMSTAARSSSPDTISHTEKRLDITRKFLLKERADKCTSIVVFSTTLPKITGEITLPIIRREPAPGQNFDQGAVSCSRTHYIITIYTKRQLSVFIVNGNSKDFEN